MCIWIHSDRRGPAVIVLVCTVGGTERWDYTVCWCAKGHGPLQERHFLCFQSSKRLFRSESSGRLRKRLALWSANKCMWNYLFKVDTVLLGCVAKHVLFIISAVLLASIKQKDFLLCVHAVWQGTWCTLSFNDLQNKHIFPTCYELTLKSF